MATIKRALYVVLLVALVYAETGEEGEKTTENNAVTEIKSPRKNGRKYRHKNGKNGEGVCQLEVSCKGAALDGDLPVKLPIKGPRGPPGKSGEKGERGLDGMPGIPGMPDDLRERPKVIPLEDGMYADTMTRGDDEVIVEEELASVNDADDDADYDDDDDDDDDIGCTIEEVCYDEDEIDTIYLDSDEEEESLVEELWKLNPDSIDDENEAGSDEELFEMADQSGNDVIKVVTNQTADGNGFAFKSIGVDIPNRPIAVPVSGDDGVDKGDGMPTQQAKSTELPTAQPLPSGGKVGNNLEEDSVVSDEDGTGGGHPGNDKALAQREESNSCGMLRAGLVSMFYGFVCTLLF